MPDLVQGDIVLVQNFLAKLLYFDNRVEQQFICVSIIGDAPWNGLDSLPALQGNQTQLEVDELIIGTQKNSFAFPSKYKHKRNASHSMCTYRMCELYTHGRVGGAL